ncbi:MAG: hypothetical protein M0P00_04785 [Bacteroidaceae bacterium]|nr:hypothetical protein [Bacteroidaceae bacterium]
MKKIYNLFIGIIACFAMIACSPSEENYDGLGSTPSVDDIDATVAVDQSTNIVTFTLNNENANPVWIYNGSILSTVNGFTKKFTKAGDYTVEVKMYNRNGMTEGSASKTFTIDQTRVDATLLAELCGTTSKTWIWDSTVNGHFGCGPSGSSTGTDWWSCSADGKAGVGLYDDEVTFNVDRTYIFNPGNGGTVFVNTGVTISTLASYNTNDGNDYQVPATTQTSTYEFDYDGDQLMLILPAEIYLSYICNNDVYNTPRFKISSISEDKMVLLYDNGNICWRYQFVPKE